ncbi:MAG TPA: hypothetical protein ENK57_07825, partial [Polyangiaceae bacterium]|nr:hypothetical protein [Polyangiaceae bacterium]
GDDDDGDDDDGDDDDGDDDDGDEDFDGPSAWHLAALRLGPALDKQGDAQGITVAILDTGLKSGTPGLENVPVSPGHDFINNDSDPTDDDGHGTMLAGILASEGEFPGVAPGVTIMPVKVLDDARTGTEGALVDGIEFAVASGADVISMSLAFPAGYIPSYELSRAIDLAKAAGVVLVGASGNHGTGEIGYPAAFGDVIAVGGGRMAKSFKSLSPEDALEVEGHSYAKKVAKADYSGWGANIDVLGPGGSMDHDLDGDLFPDAVPAVGFTSADPTFASYLMAGTSPATVQVAGLAALLLAGGAQPADIRPLLLEHATDVDGEGFDIFAGAGVADAKDSVKFLKKGKIPSAPKVFANPIVTMADAPTGERYAVAMVEVIDIDNNPLVGAKVIGHFRGDVAHAVEAITDAQGRVIMVSQPAAAGSQLFEFGVDKVITCDGGFSAGCDETVRVPGSFARFEANSFYFFSAFPSGGTGIDPNPFMIFIPTDLLSPVVADFRLSAETGAPTAPDPVSGLPSDFDTFTLTESLLVRSFGTAGASAPVVFTVAKSVLQSGCSITERGTVIPSTGGVGIDPNPFRIGEDVLGLPGGFDNIMSRSDGGLFYNGNPTTEADLGLLTGTTGTILIDADGSICVPQSREVTNLELFDQDIQNGVTVTSYGISYVGTADSPQPAPAPLSLEDTVLHQALAQGVVSSAVQGTSTQASAAVQP